LNYRLTKQSRTTQANRIKDELFKKIIDKHKQLYILHFNEIIDHFLTRLEIVEKSERKSLSKLEFKIGQKILSPLRKLKRFFS